MTTFQFMSTMTATERETMCKAIKKNGEPCTEEVEYGVLCKRHARQISQTPNGFQHRRVVRIHLHQCTDDEVREACFLFRQVHGEKVKNTAHPLSYRTDAILYLADGEKSASQIVAHLNGLSYYDMSPSKVGQLMRALMNEGTVVRRHTNINGVWGAVYALIESVGRDDL
jgi:hypothetical protein